MIGAEMSPEPADRAAALSGNGHRVVRGLLSDPEVEALRSSLEFLRHAAAPSREILYTHRLPDAAPSRGMAALMDQWINPHRRAGAASTLPAAARLRRWVGELLECEAVLFQDVLMDKRGHHRPFPWHQDFPFWPVDRPEGVVIWAALDPIDERRGGLCVAATAGDRPGPAIDLHSGAPQPGFEGWAAELPVDHVCPTLAPGDAIAFAPLTWHCSGRNCDDGPRRVWATTWLATGVRWCHAAAPRHPFVRWMRDGAPVGAGCWAPLVEEACR